MTLSTNHPISPPSKPLFALGRLVSTPSATQVMETLGLSPFTLLRRHVSGDWGDLCEDDKHYNDEALTDNTRLLSAYQITEAVKIWVITEADRSVTTLLLPEDY